jgi:serine/threonine protein kinase
MISYMGNLGLPPILEEIRPELEEKGYNLERMLSKQGASGPSYSVTCLAQNDNRPVTLKISSYGLLHSYGDDIDNIEKLGELKAREILTNRQVNHPNIPKFIENFRITHKGVIPLDIIIMQYIDALSLQQRIEEGKMLSEPEAKIVLEDGLSALNYLHTKRILHRDIKPANVFLNDQAWVSDFDIVQYGEGTSSTAIDTFGYYPVDAFSGRHDQSQDLVALGNVVTAGGLGKSIADIRWDQGLPGFAPVDLKEVPYSGAMKDFLRKLTTDPKHRYQIAKDALRDLEGLASNVAIRTSLSGEPTKRETIREMLKQYRSKLSGISSIGKNIKEFGEFFLGVGAVLATLPYYLPTFSRLWRETTSEDTADSPARNIGGGVGIFGGLLSYIGQIEIYSYLVKEGHPEFLLIPLFLPIRSPEFMN